MTPSDTENIHLTANDHERKTLAEADAEFMQKLEATTIYFAERGT